MSNPLRRARANLAVCWFGIAVNTFSFTTYVLAMPQGHAWRPLVCALQVSVMLMLLRPIQQWRELLWLAHAREAPPPMMAVHRGDDEQLTFQLDLTGIDPDGAPAWVVYEGRLESGDRVMVTGLTKRAVIYVPTDEVGILRLTQDRR